MAFEYVRLLNTTDNILRLRFSGEAITFQPHGLPGSVLDLPKAAADYCVGHLGTQVQIVAQDAAISYVDQQKVERYYVANFSGNPDSPPYFEETFRNKTTGEGELRRIPNENHLPQVFTVRLGRMSDIIPAGAYRYFDKVEGWTTNKRPMQVTLPGKLLKIPPYTVVEVTRGQFETLLNIDNDRPKERRGLIKPSRPVSEFEPDYNDPKWTYDKMRAWIEQMPETNDAEAGAAVMGPSETELRKQWAEEGLDEDKIGVRLAKARYDMYARCKIRAMDNSYVLPTRAEFEAHWARKAKSEKQAK